MHEVNIYSFDILGDDGGVMGVTGFVGLFIGVCGILIGLGFNFFFYGYILIHWICLWCSEMFLVDFY